MHWLLGKLPTSHCALEASIVVTCDLVVDVVCPVVLVAIILVWPSHQSPIQHLRVWVWAVEVIPATLSWPVRTGPASHYHMCKM